LPPRITRRILKLKNNEDLLPHLKVLEKHINELWLTRFLSDSGDYTDPLDDAKLKYFHYSSGGHGVPYSEDDFINIGSKGEWEGVFIRKEDWVERDLPTTGQLSFEFEDK